MADINEPDDLDSDDLNEIDYGDDDDVESTSDHNIELSDREDGTNNADDGNIQHRLLLQEDTGYDVTDRKYRTNNVDDSNIEKRRSILDPSDSEEEGAGEGEQNQDDSDQGKDNGDISNSEKRCKYWPACNAGNKCSFWHPTKPCRHFPKCLYGDGCLFIHPPCKFKQHCRIASCNFAHPAVLAAPAVAKRMPPVSHQHGPSKHHTTHSATPKCKYGAKCNNPMCKFSHEASGPCRYGSNCLLETCHYSHPTDLPREKPSSIFKWEAPS